MGFWVPENRPPHGAFLMESKSIPSEWKAAPHLLQTDVFQLLQGLGSILKSARRVRDGTTQPRYTETSRAEKFFTSFIASCPTRIPPAGCFTITAFIVKLLTWLQSAAQQSHWSTGRWTLDGGGTVRT